MELTGATIAVTGATGFLGSHVALALREAGAGVRGVVRSPEKGTWLLGHGVELARADLLDRDALAAAFAGSDAIVANAGLLSVGLHSWKEYYATNKTGTENVFEAAAEAGVRRIVLVSTVGVYRIRLCRTVDERAARLRLRDRPFAWGYGVSKALSEEVAEAAARRHDLALTVLRPSPIYGSRDRTTVPIYRFFMRFPVLPAPSFGLPHVHVGDVAQAIVGALRNDASVGNTYNLAGDPHTIRDFVRTWKRVRGRGPILVPLPVPAFVGYDTTAARRDLGFRNRPLEEGLRETFSDEADS